MFQAFMELHNDEQDNQGQQEVQQIQNNNNDQNTFRTKTERDILESQNGIHSNCFVQCQIQELDKILIKYTNAVKENNEKQMTDQENLFISKYVRFYSEARLDSRSSHHEKKRYSDDLVNKAQDILEHFRLQALEELTSQNVKTGKQSDLQSLNQEREITNQQQKVDKYNTQKSVNDLTGDSGTSKKPQQQNQQQQEPLKPNPQSKPQAKTQKQQNRQKNAESKVQEAPPPEKYSLDDQDYLSSLQELVKSFGIEDHIQTEQLLKLHQIAEYYKIETQILIYLLQYLDAIDEENEYKKELKRAEYKKTYRDMMLSVEDYSDLSKKERQEVEKSMDEMADMTLNMLEQDEFGDLSDLGFDLDDIQELGDLDSSDMQYWEDYLQRQGMN